jgi:hypothetical protein
MMGACGADDVVVECVLLRQLSKKLRFKMAADIVTVVLAQIIVLARGGAEVYGIRLAGALLVPFPEAG